MAGVFEELIMAVKSWKLDSYSHLLAIGLLIALTLIVFWQAFGFGFVSIDDPSYVINNERVHASLTPESLRWALRATDNATWQPLVWISYMLDWRLYGLNPSGYHLTNLLLHLLNVLLLFALLRRMTLSTWKSALVAALFAIHPLHVESVVWITERKDVLSAFFWMLALLAYVRYAEKPTLPKYVLIIIAFVLGLMAKPMLVTLPFVLLLLDYWPLGRFAKLGAARLAWEKVPLFLIAAGSVIMSYRVHETSGALGTLTAYPTGARIANALVAHVSYILKMLWPAKLAVFYPHPGNTLPIWQTAVSGLVLVVVSVLAIRSRRACFAMGWFWYVGTLIPTIGLIQTGSHAMADRFTYIPLIGLFIAIIWSIPRKALNVSAAIVITILAACSWRQVGYWQDSRTLFEHALDVTRNNYVAEYSLGVEDQKEGNLDDAVAHFSAALEIEPDYDKARYNLGIALDQQGRLDDAITQFKETIRLNPKFAKAYNNLGIALGKQRRLEEEIEAYQTALKIDPTFSEARNNLAVSLFYAKDYAGAWHEVHLLEEQDFTVHPLFLKDLAAKMPDPGAK